jgi:tetratricopeptide (TPR) repeat protein
MNIDVDDKLPQRSAAHVIGDRALNAFRYKIKPEWPNEESRRDYGWDLLLTIVQNEKVADQLFVQLKGHQKPNYIDEGQYVSEPLAVATVNWLLRKPMPSMLCVCDIGNQEKLYYVWINEDIHRIEKENPDWRSQGSINIRVPVSNIIERDIVIHNRIEEYVTTFHNALRNDREIISVLSPALGIDEEKRGILSKDAVLQMARPTWEKAGLIDDSADDIESYSPEEQELLRRIKETSTLLNNFQTTQAIKVLDELSEKIDYAPSSLKAKYFNNRGICRRYEGDVAGALRFYKDAVDLSPRNHRIAVNLLNTEFEHYRINDQFEGDRHKDWLKRLDEVLREHPDYHPAVLTKTYFIGETIGKKEADEYLKSKTTWQAEPLKSKACLAEVYMRTGDFENAKDFLKDVVAKDYFPPYALLGFINLKFATGTTNNDKEYYVTGVGPSSLNYDLLREAERNYRQAYEILLRLGLPKLSDEIVVNYSTVLHLLFKHEESLRVCKSVIDLHPDSLPMQGAMAQSYLGSGAPGKAIPFAQKAFEANPNTTTLKNYCICLFEAEDYDTVVSIINANIESEVAKHEKGLLLSLLALAYNEIGDEAKSKDTLKLMKASADLAGNAISAEAIICIRMDEVVKSSELF